MFVELEKTRTTKYKLQLKEFINKCLHVFINNQLIILLNPNKNNISEERLPHLRRITELQRFK